MEFKMAEYLEIGTVPSEEKCPQVGYCDPDLMKKVAGIYRDQLQRFADENKLNVQFVIKSFAHDFGQYTEVSCKIENDEQWGDAVHIENDCPTVWDNVAKKQLKIVWPDFESKTV
jgi:hypothetical protein